VAKTEAITRGRRAWGCTSTT